MPAIQMTDSVVLIDTQAFSLADGSFMWELDLKQDSDKRYRFSGTAGHHTLITKKACENGHEDDPRPSACDLTLINDDDPDSEHLLMNVVGSPEDGLTVVDGWVVRYSDRDANASRADKFLLSMFFKTSVTYFALKAMLTAGPSMEAATI